MGLFDDAYLLTEVTSDQEERALALAKVEGLQAQVSRWLALKAAQSRFIDARFQCASCGGIFPETQNLRLRAVGCWWEGEVESGSAMQPVGMHLLVVLSCPRCYHRPHSVWMQEVRDGRYKTGNFREPARRRGGAR